MSETLLARVLTPENEKKSDSPLNLWIYTKEFGETTAVINPDREKNANLVSTEYEINVPEEILGVCRYVEAMGGKALLVGGCVRDNVISKEISDLDIKPKDWDLEIYGIPSQTLHLILERRFGQSMELTGKDFPIYKVNHGNVDVDITIPRRDSKVAPGSRGFIVSGDPSMTIPEAAIRRDLTINSMAYDPLQKKLYDPYDAVSDIKDKVIRATDMEHFKEDPLRVLRIMQFVARFEFKVDSETIALCKSIVEQGDIDNEPWERITVEIQKLFTKGVKPSLGLEFAKEVGLIDRYYPQLKSIIGVPQEPEWHPEGDVWTHELQTIDAAVQVAIREGLSEEDRLVLVLTLLGHDLGKATKTIIKEGRVSSHGHEGASVAPARELFESKYFKIPSHISKRVLALIPEHMHPKTFHMESEKGIDMKSAVARLAKRLAVGDETVYMLSLVAESDQRGRNGVENRPLDRHQVKDLEEWQSWLISTASDIEALYGKIPELLSGQDVLSILDTKKGGVHVGAILSIMYQLQMKGAFASREIAVNKLPQITNELLDMSGGIKNEQFWIQVKKDPDTYIQQISDI